jgi:hypothetical protein
MNPRIIAAVFLACAPFALALERDQAKDTDAAEDAAKQLRERIQAEAAALPDHPWAGEYYLGDGLGNNVRVALAPSAGCLFERRGCLGLYDRNYGAVTEIKGTIRLSFKLKNVREGSQGIAEEFVPVAWGERHYMIPADDLLGFCNDVNSGIEPREGPLGSYLLRYGDEKKTVSGFPILPKKYQQYLLTEPITAQIISINAVSTRTSGAKWRYKDTTVTLDGGKNKGLWEGMTMHVVKPPVAVKSIRVIYVDNAFSQALMTQLGAEEQSPKKGWRFSTRQPWVGQRELNQAQVDGSQNQRAFTTVPQPEPDYTMGKKDGKRITGRISTPGRDGHVLQTKP